MVGLVLYISSINDEVMNRPSSSEQYFHYRYGWSFAFAASSFLLKEVMSVGPNRNGDGSGGGRLIPGGIDDGFKREVVTEDLTPGPGGGSGSSQLLGSWCGGGAGAWTHSWV